MGVRGARLTGPHHGSPRSMLSNYQEYQMRRSHQEIQERVAARRGEFVSGEVSEIVLRASFKALGLSADEIEYQTMLAAREFIRARRSVPPDPEITRMQEGIAFVEKYLKG